MKVSRQCPLVLLEKVDLKGVKTFGCKEGRDLRGGARREVEHGSTALNYNPEFRH
jgi:hypothetical protein